MTICSLKNFTALFVAAFSGGHLLAQVKDTPVDINIIELRNYVIRPGARDRFIDYFEENFIQSQITLGGYPLGEFRIKDEDDHFFWLRGFESMSKRSKFLPAFYRGPVWKQYGPEANSMLVNNDNVYLLKPLTWQNDSLGEHYFLQG